MPNEHKDCCSDVILSDMRALSRACRTAAHLPSAQDRAKTIREAGLESASNSEEYDTLIDAIAAMAEARTGARGSQAASVAQAQPLGEKTPMVMLAGIVIAGALGLAGLLYPSVPPLPTDLVRQPAVDNVVEQTANNGILINEYDQRIVTLEGWQEDVATWIEETGAYQEGQQAQQSVEEAQRAQLMADIETRLQILEAQQGQ